jgi:hypothetical protein
MQLIRRGIAFDIEGSIKTATRPGHTMEISFFRLQERTFCATLKLTLASMQPNLYKVVFNCFFILTNAVPKILFNTFRRTTLRGFECGNVI